MPSVKFNQAPAPIQGSFSKSLAQTVFDARPDRGPWTEYMFAKETRVHVPASVYASEGSVEKPDGLCVDAKASSTLIRGRDATLTLDFGLNINGIPTLVFGSASDEGQIVQIGFSESNQFITRNSDRAMDFFVEDGPLLVHVDQVKNRTWTAPRSKQRGGFRYLTLSLDTTGTVEFTSLTVHNTMMPHWGDDLRQYGGFFYSSDDFMNKIWYAGAYTIQMATIPCDTGRSHEMAMDRVGYDNGEPCGTGKAVLTDGARRDRTVWSGDRGVSTVSQFISLNDPYTSQTGVEWIFQHQDPETGQLPYATPPIDEWGSDTYHIWSLIALYNAYFYAGGDLEWVRPMWPGFKHAMDFALAKVDPAYGLLNVDHCLDWGRVGMGGHNMEANSILYYSLIKGTELAERFGENQLSLQWKNTAEALKVAINKHLWSEGAGMFRDNLKTELTPQDGNTLAIWYDVADSPDKFRKISDGLLKFWNDFGSVAPESPGMISPFCSSMELVAHLIAGNAQRSIDLIRLMWGWIWNAPYSVQSSLIEGYYKDGTCFYPFQEYDPGYISHAHPWASGPTIALSQYVVGIQFTSPDHSRWSFAPAVDLDLEFALAGITSNNVGLLSAGWSKSSPHLFEMACKAPKDTHGHLKVPFLGGKNCLIFLDGQLVVSNGLEQVSDGTYVDIGEVGGGEHTVLVVYT